MNVQNVIIQTKRGQDNQPKERYIHTNTKQFDDEKDLDKYQKILGNECILVSKIGCNAIFKNNKCDKV